MVGGKLHIVVVIGKIVDAFLRSDGADNFGRYAHGHHPGRHMHTGRHHGTGSDDGIVLHHGAAKQDGIHADKHAMADTGPMQHGPMAGGNLVADGLINPGIAMNDDAVLYVGAAAKGDAGHITTDDGSKPDAAIFADHDVAADAGVIRPPKSISPANAVWFNAVHRAIVYSGRRQKGKVVGMTADGRGVGGGYAVWQLAWAGRGAYDRGLSMKTRF